METPPPRARACVDCHQGQRPDINHALPCMDCHGGQDPALNREAAHEALVTRPAHPERMAATCGPCHPKEVKGVAGSLHFTLANKINLIRRHFGADRDLASLTEIPAGESIATELNLADDMLRRRCLRCHVWAPGDDYPLVNHATGCAACHLPYQDGEPVDHGFVRSPGDRQCLSCHYANFVGADYHGLHEHDFNWEYRTPYVTRNNALRPYGVETHDLVPDAHQRAGMACIDCHTGVQLMASPPASAPSCAGCHAWATGRPLPADNLHERGGKLVLITRHGGRELEVPAMRDPAHTALGAKVACVVCHAQWSYNDHATHLLLSPDENLDPWEDLMVQSSSEVEALLGNNLFGDGEELAPTMRDGISGEARPGLWFQGYDQRRWEQPIIARDSDGVIKLFRPILKLRLSAVDEEGQPLFDNVRGQGPELLPYTPHTIGKVGPFFRARLNGGANKAVVPGEAR